MIDALKGIGVKRQFLKNEALFLEGDSANGFYYILEGVVKLIKTGLDGKEIEVTRLGAGDFLAEVILFSTERYPVSAFAAKDTVVLFFERAVVLDAIRESQSVSLFLLRLLADKCLYLNTRIEDLTLKSVHEQLFAYFLRVCATQHTNLIRLPMKKKDLACYFGITPEALSRNLLRLESDGMIQVEGKLIRIFEPAA